MYIAVNKVAASAEQAQGVLEGFKRAMPGMTRFTGFLGMELWTAEDGSIQAISRWTSKEALDEYLNNDLFKHHHGSASSQQTSHPTQTAYYSAEVIS